jgi:hypothetical protein
VQAEMEWELFHEESGLWAAEDLLSRSFEDITVEGGKAYYYKITFTFKEATTEGTSITKQANNVA